MCSWLSHWPRTWSCLKLQSNCAGQQYSWKGGIHPLQLPGKNLQAMCNILWKFAMHSLSVFDHRPIVCYRAFLGHQLNKMLFAYMQERDNSFQSTFARIVRPMQVSLLLGILSSSKPKQPSHSSWHSTRQQCDSSGEQTEPLAKETGFCDWPNQRDEGAFPIWWERPVKVCTAMHILEMCQDIGSGATSAAWGGSGELKYLIWVENWKLKIFSWKFCAPNKRWE